MHLQTQTQTHTQSNLNNHECRDELRKASEAISRTPLKHNYWWNGNDIQNFTLVQDSAGGDIK